MSAAQYFVARCAAERATHLSGRMVPARSVAESCGALSVTKISLLVKISSMLILHCVYESAAVLARAVAQVHAGHATSLSLWNLRALVALVELATGGAVWLVLVNSVSCGAAARLAKCVPTCLSSVHVSVCVRGGEVYQFRLVHRARINWLEARRSHA